MSPSWHVRTQVTRGIWFQSGPLGGHVCCGSACWWLAEDPASLWGRLADGQLWQEHHSQPSGTLGKANCTEKGWLPSLDDKTLLYKLNMPVKSQGRYLQLAWVRTFVNVPVHVIMNHRYSSTPHISQNFKSSTYVHCISREKIVLFKKDTKKLIILSLN